MKTLSAIFSTDFLQMVMKSLAFAEALGQHVNLNTHCDKGQSSEGFSHFCCFNLTHNIIFLSE